MGFYDRITQVLDPNEFVPAPGQGVIAMECREKDSSTLRILNDINDLDTQHEAELERTFLRKIGGDCNIPAGCYANVSGDNISAAAFVSDHEGRSLIKSEVRGGKEKSVELGDIIAEDILQNGGYEILKTLKTR